MALRAAVTLPALHFEDTDLRVLALSRNGANDLGAVDAGGSDLDAFVAADHQDFAELDRVTDLATEFFNSDSSARIHSDLLPTSMDNGCPFYTSDAADASLRVCIRYRRHV